MAFKVRIAVLMALAEKLSRVDHHAEPVARHRLHGS